MTRSTFRVQWPQISSEQAQTPPSLYAEHSKMVYLEVQCGKCAQLHLDVLCSCSWLMLTQLPWSSTVRWPGNFEYLLRVCTSTILECSLLVLFFLFNSKLLQEVSDAVICPSCGISYKDWTTLPYAKVVLQQTLCYSSMSEPRVYGEPGHHTARLLCHWGLLMPLSFGYNP